MTKTWEVRYYFRHGELRGKRMGPVWELESKEKPIKKKLFENFSEQEYRCTVKEAKK